MSRPFSYNDENFTVIGNVLFCHIKLKEAVLMSEPIVEIPPAIYERMLYKTNKFLQARTYNNSTSSYVLDIGVGKKDDKKYFFIL